MLIYRKALISLLVLFSACVRLAHIEPESRTVQTRRLATVRVLVSCNPFPATPPSAGDTDADHWFEDESFATSKWATGVIISERHVLTAGHAVGCLSIPEADVYLLNGKHMHMAVTHDDIVFGQGQDVGRLEIASADRFHTYIKPPKLAGTESTAWCAYTLHGVLCGKGSRFHWTLDVETKKGDSGSAVYDEFGDLVGIVVRSGKDYTIVQPIEARWLEGT